MNSGDKSGIDVKIKCKKKPEPVSGQSFSEKSDQSKREIQIERIKCLVSKTSIPIVQRRSTMTANSKSRFKLLNGRSCSNPKSRNSISQTEPHVFSLLQRGKKIKLKNAHASLLQQYEMMSKQNNQI